MSFTVPKELEAELDELTTHYPQKRSASLMFLHAIQERFGCISPEAMEWTAQKLDLQPINIYELVTFYPMFRQENEKVGKHQIKICRTLSCALGGSHRIAGTFLQKAGAGRIASTARKPPKTANTRSNLSNAWPVAAPRRW